MNNPFEYKVGERCVRAFAELLDKIEALRESNREEDRSLCRELDSGKMLGALIAEDCNGGSHTFYAFSGQIGDAGFNHPLFVGPVFDYLRPDGYFKIHEAEISDLNSEIVGLKQLADSARLDYEDRKIRVEEEVREYAEECKKAKKGRALRRSSGEADDAELESMIRRSQFEKAELRRRRHRASEELRPYEEELRSIEKRVIEMKEKRRKDSELLQRWLFDNFRVFNAKGERRTLSEIFAETSLGIPPSGAGECCAPKLLQAAYLQGYRPIEIAEMWYGKPRRGEVRRHGEYYPACRGKCLPVLGWMLQGLEVTPPMDCMETAVEIGEPEILYEGEWFCVVNKPSGMLSVPGKGRHRSVQEWLVDKYGISKDVRMAHRLDQDTSGLLIATFGREAYKEMQAMFARREVLKTYIADLEGDYIALERPRAGRINLPLSPDLLDRPRQRVDHVDGRDSATDYEFIQSGVNSRVVFKPWTGRTHQLRVHSASAEGLGMPIVGDRLYGHVSDRLHLHAWRLRFTSPFDGLSYLFDAPIPF